MEERAKGHPAILVTLILMIGAFYIATIREGQVWGDDFALYIHHAKNIAYGHSYADTGYIYNPHYPVLGPKAYPPLFPLLLAPVYRVMGLNLTSMKVLNILFFLMALCFIYGVCQLQLRLYYALAVLMILACNPYLWTFKDHITSDFLFLLLIYVTLYLMLTRSSRYTFASSAVIAICIALCYATRIAGVVLLPCVLLLDMIRFQTVKPATLRTFGLALALIVPQIIWFNGSNSYVDSLRTISLPAIMNNIQLYFWSLSKELWRNGYSSFAALFLCAVLGVLSLWGYILTFRHRISILEIFVPAYGAMIILWSPDQDLRFLMPLIPLWLYYVAIGLQGLEMFVGRRWIQLIASVLLLFISGSYASAYSKEEYSPFRQGLGDPSFTELCEYIKKETASGSVFLFSKPRLLSLLTDRPASGYQDPLKQTELWDYCAEIGVDYIITSNKFDRDRVILEPFVGEYRDRIGEIYHNNEFRLYRVDRGGVEILGHYKTDSLGRRPR